MRKKRETKAEDKNNLFLSFYFIIIRLIFVIKISIARIVN